jgi:DNA-binding MarR family transcriptional regulator
MIDFESQSARTLLALAGCRSGIDTARCELAFSYLGAAARMRCGVRSALARHQLSDLQFAILVVLFEAEPEPIPMAILADHAGVSRSAVTDALDGLEISGLANRARDRRDRRIIQARITAAGCEKTDQAINDYLGAAGHAANIEGLERWSGARMEGQRYGVR